MERNGKSVMIVGIGDLGGWVLEFLARSNGVNRIIAADIREEYGLHKTNCATIGASLQGYLKDIEFRKVDLNDIDGTAELLNSVQPDLIYSAVTLQSWWVRRLLPKDIMGEMARVGTGPLITTNLVLIHKLMQAVKKTGITAHVLNHSGPDFTNPVLWRNGFRPTLGAGNLQFATEVVRHRVSKAENVPIGDVTVYGFGVHAVVMRDLKKDHVPYYMKCIVRDKDVTSKYDIDAFLAESSRGIPAGPQISWLTHPFIAACAVKNILGIINDTNEISSVPGPNGLIGCYPVRLSASGVEIVLPEGLTLEEAIKINLDGLKWDGYKEIKDNGTIVFTEAATEVYKKFLGIEIKELQLKDADEIVKELLAAYNNLAKKHKAATYLY